MHDTLRWTMRSLALAALLGACSGPGGPGGTPIPGQPDSDGIKWGNDGTNDPDTPTDQDTADDTGPEPDVPELPKNIPCESNSGCPIEVPFCGEDSLCKQCQGDNDCLEGTCEDGFCVSDSCEPGAKKCNANTALVCKANGTGWLATPCGEGVCEAGSCSLCTPEATRCEGLTVKTCNTDGSAWETTNQCGAEQKCLNGECLDCYPGALRCVGTTIERCEDGAFTFLEDCADQGMSCALGTCWDACLVDAKESNAGCDYFAVNTDNIPSAINAPNYQYSVVVANFGSSPVDVTVLARDSAGGPENEIATATVAGDGLQVIDLPKRTMGSSGIFWGSYRVKSTGPIVAAQFNPLENVAVYSNDASLLLPANTFGQEYVVVAREQFDGGDPPVPWRGFASVVAKDDGTKVTVVPSVNCQAGNGVQAMAAGGTYEFTLDRYQVLNIKSNQDGGDLTGTIITADKPVGAYSGHDAAITSDQCCADHLEHQLFPVETWGVKYVAGKSFPRGKESDYWKIIAAEDGTQVTFTPAVNGTVNLNRGEFFEFKSTQHFVVESTKPISVVQTLASSGEIGGPSSCSSTSECASGWTCVSLFFTGTCEPPTCSTQAQCPGGTTCTNGYCEPVGDPAMILAPPEKQWRDEYIFLSPNKYLNDYVTIMAPSDAVVTLDGLTVPSGNYQTIPGTGYKIGRLNVSDGVHTLTSTVPVGLVAYGYDDDVSYGYTAGLNLSED